MLVDSFAHMLEKVPKGVPWTDKVSLINGYEAYLALESKDRLRCAYTVVKTLRCIGCRLPRKVVRGPVTSRWWYWSLMRLIVGIKTTVRVLVATQGNWKQRLFPAPVLWTTRVFFPSKVAEMIAFCQDLKDGLPKTWPTNPEGELPHDLWQTQQR